MFKVTIVNLGSASRGVADVHKVQHMLHPGESRVCEISDNMRSLYESMARHRDPLLAFARLPEGEDAQMLSMICDFLRLHSDMSYHQMLSAFQSIAGTNALTMRPTRPAMVGKISELARVRFADYCISAHHEPRAADAPDSTSANTLSTNTPDSVKTPDSTSVKTPDTPPPPPPPKDVKPKAELAKPKRRVGTPQKKTGQPKRMRF